LEYVQMLFGPEVTMAVQDPSYPVTPESLQRICMCGEWLMVFASVVSE
jgi:hypothetical protein